MSIKPGPLCGRSYRHDAREWVGIGKRGSVDRTHWRMPGLHKVTCKDGGPDAGQEEARHPGEQPQGR